MNESEGWRRPSGAPVPPSPRHRLGQEDPVALPSHLGSPAPRTFMRSKFLDNLVLRSDAMLAPAGDRICATKPTAHAHCYAHSGGGGGVLRSVRLPAPCPRPRFSRQNTPGLATSLRGRASLWRKRRLRARPPVQGGVSPRGRAAPRGRSRRRPALWSLGGCGRPLSPRTRPSGRSRGGGRGPRRLARLAPPCFADAIVLVRPWRLLPNRPAGPVSFTCS